MEQFANELKSPVIFSGRSRRPKTFTSFWCAAPAPSWRWTAKRRRTPPGAPTCVGRARAALHALRRRLSRSPPRRRSPCVSLGPGRIHTGLGEAAGLRVRKDVIVVGGGPAGMSAARAARLRGARVRLIEKRAQPGGGLLAAAKLPARKAGRSSPATWPKNWSASASK